MYVANGFVRKISERNEIIPAPIASAIKFGLLFLTKRYIKTKTSTATGPNGSTFMAPTLFGVVIIVVRIVDTRSKSTDVSRSVWEIVSFL